MQQAAANSNYSTFSHTCGACGLSVSSNTPHLCPGRATSTGSGYNPYAQSQTDAKLDQLIALMNLMVTKLDKLIDLFD